MSETFSITAGGANPAFSPLGPADNANALVSAYRSDNGALDTDGLALAMVRASGGDADTMAALKQGIGAALSPSERGAVDRAIGALEPKDLTFLEHVGDGFAQFGKGLWGMAKGLAGLAWGAAKTVYDVNVVGAALDKFEAVSGQELPAFLPSEARGEARIDGAVSSVVELGKAVWNDPSILISEYKSLAADGRYGAIVGQAVVDFGDLLIGAKGAGKAAKIGNLGSDIARSADIVADAGKVLRASDSAVALAKAVAADPSFAARSHDVLQQSRAVLNAVDTSAFTAAQRLQLDEGRALLDDVLEISAPRDPNIGDPAAIARGFGTLSPRQAKMLEALPDFGDATILHKSDVKMTDIAALTAQTGDEFAIFTRGSQRMIVRGNAQSVPISVDDAVKLREAGWRWSAHTQPGVDTVHTIASAGDQAVLKAFGQDASLIMNSRGQANVFSPTETIGIQP